ncbi:hypothetical protein BN891_40380 [Bacteroides xylanisolvens SD CC 2a]|nr:hypothetical protein BN891_40380 [Bacteroides xylanisolvens SD CC 2a]
MFLFMLPAKIYEIFHIAIKKERKVKKRLGKRKKVSTTKM